LLLVGLWLAPAASGAGACVVPSATYPTIQSAVDDPGCDPINLAAGTFNQNVNLGRSVQINGAGTTSTIIDGTGGSVINISGSTPRNVGMTSLTVTGGGGAVAGGGFQVEEATHTLTLTDVAVTGNVGATEGGGLAMLDQSTLVMRGGSISNNEVTGPGGAIVADRASISLTDVHVDGNKADVGGAMYHDLGSLEVRGGTFDGNQATSVYGSIQTLDLDSVILDGTTFRGNTTGGAYGGPNLSTDTFTGRNLLVDGNVAGALAGLTVFASTSASLENSSVTNNTATASSDGGLTMGAGGPAVPLSLVNTTVSGNRAEEGAGGLGISGGAFVGTNLTITNNTADYDGGGSGGDGGGIAKSGGGTTVLRNSILFGNRDGSPGAEAPDCDGTITSGGNNIIGTTQGCGYTAGPGDQIGADPKLGPLADNGGNTLTHALLKGSPAINQADASSAPQTDQRGLQRQDPDIGAYELVYCLKVPVNRIGTSGKDKLKGTNKADGMLGLGGKDTLNGKGGKDGLCGGGGKDKLKGGGGKDRMKGQGGKDTCVGGGGNDVAVCEEERSV
jgi:hypothetical protein